MMLLDSDIARRVSHDTRNDGSFPSSGHYIHLNNEVAGLGGNVRFTKHELHSQFFVPLPRKFVCDMSSL